MTEVRRYVPDELPEGIPLRDLQDYGNVLWLGPSQDFTGRPVDPYVQRRAQFEAGLPQMQRESLEAADTEVSHDQQQAYLDLVQRIIAEQAQYSRMMANREMAGVPMNTMAGMYPPMARPSAAAAGLPLAGVSSTPTSPAVAAPQWQYKRLKSGEAILDEIKVSDELSFRDAFALARKRDASLFTWRGKTYTTKMK